MESKNPDVSVYTGDLSGLPDLKALAIQSYDHLLVVDAHGLVRENKKVSLDGLDLGKFDKPSTKGHTVSKEVTEKLEQLPSNEAVKKIHEQLKELHYPVKLTLSFVEEYSPSHPDHKQAKNLDLHIGIR